MITASFQPLVEKGSVKVGVLRVHKEEGDWEQRTDWVWGCTMKVDNNHAELLGALKAPAHQEARAIRLLLIEEGIESVEYEIKGREDVRLGDKLDHHLAASVKRLDKFIDLL